MTEKPQPPPGSGRTFLGSEISWKNIAVLFGICSTLMGVSYRIGGQMSGFAEAAEVEAHAESIKRLETSDVEQWTAIEGIRRTADIRDEKIDSLTVILGRLERNSCLTLVELGVRDVRECRETTTP